MYLKGVELTFQIVNTTARMYNPRNKFGRNTKTVYFCLLAKFAFLLIFSHYLADLREK